MRLTVSSPATIDSNQMQDLHYMPAIVKELQASGYDCAIGSHANEVAVFGNTHIHILSVTAVDQTHA